jgi:hypothetical protein
MTTLAISSLSFTLGILIVGAFTKNDETKFWGFLALIAWIWAVGWFQQGASWQREDWEPLINTNKCASPPTENPPTEK